MKAFCITDVGQNRSMNQDFVFASETPVGNLPNLFVVADGMGGHRAGDTASRDTVGTLIESVRKSRETNPSRSSVLQWRKPTAGYTRNPGRMKIWLAWGPPW